jgi:ABC-type sugar transport system permease subunit
MSETTLIPDQLAGGADVDRAHMPGRVGKLWAQIRRNYIAYLFLTPAFFLMIVFLAVPLIQSLILSFYQWNGINQRTWVGLENFRRLLTDDSVFLLALKNNTFFSLSTTTGTVVLGFLLALAIERRVRGWRFFKVAYFLPVMMSTTVVGLLWGRLFDPVFGPINTLLKSLGWQQPPDWLGDPNLALFSTIGVSIWQYAGFPMIIFLAAIESIPAEIHDAATLDGVTWFQRATRIILPLVMNVVAVIVMLQLIFSFKVFDIVWAMTTGGPGDASNVLGIYLYRTAFRYTQFGYGSAIAVMMFLIIFILSMVYLRLFRPEHVEY